ncbi:pyridoxal phosphate-dependent decarboxylase family protein [Ruegeria lacuscaerulensis]|uniref:pyridoxal phosphate-dependent decarboxylase family protein n=1 Tax=Ruegeria lacuscaerulensis TaxID=55218 RepID=UPI00147BDA32|nr:aminotransferase class V-fold PLP-dependent enzyme [Ruegeria lacuscaerulensis]
MNRKKTQLCSTDTDLLLDADRRANRYLAEIADMDVFPKELARSALSRFDEDVPENGFDTFETLSLLDDIGSPGTVASNGSRYFGFVIGATIPVAAAAQRMMLAWDQCASSYTNSPSADVIEKVAARWILDILDLPRESGVTFGTSASSSTLVCLATARRTLLLRKNWNQDIRGLSGAPEIRVVISEKVHVTVRKALRVLGFGEQDMVVAPVDEKGRIDPSKLPHLDEMTILCLQAGEVNTGNFDPFPPLMEVAKAANAWVHVDGAFGLWARAAPTKRRLTDGVELANSWTTDGHKWLNTPYDGAVGICRDRHALADAMNSDADYSSASAESQKNLGIEFSRSARGIPFWAVLRSLGRTGVAAMIERHCALAEYVADALAEAGFNLLTRPVLNQVLFSFGSSAETAQIQSLVAAKGKVWFGMTVWNEAPAMRISISSWRTVTHDVDLLISELKAAAQVVRSAG